MHRCFGSYIGLRAPKLGWSYRRSGQTEGPEVQATTTKIGVRQFCEEMDFRGGFLIRRPSGTLGHRPLDAAENNPSSQEYLLGGVYPSPYPLPLAKVELRIAPSPLQEPRRCQSGPRGAQEGVLALLWGPLGAFWCLRCSILVTFWGVLFASPFLHRFWVLKWS